MTLAFGLARLADRFGRRRFLIGGPLLGMFAVLLLAPAAHPAQIGVARLLGAVGAPAFVPTALAPIPAAPPSAPAVRPPARGAARGRPLFGYAGGLLVGPL